MQSKKERAIQTAYRSDGPGSATWLSPALIESALILLRQAWSERETCREWEHTPNNHHARHAPGSVILLCTAVEAILNETLFFFFHKGARGIDGDFQIEVPDGEDLLTLPTFKKYEALLESVAPQASPLIDFRLLFEVRDSLVHFLPRYLSCFSWELEKLVRQPNIPPWLRHLADQRLLYVGEYGRHHGESLSDCDEYSWGEMFESFRLAYWSWETVDVALFNAASKCSDDGYKGVISEARNRVLGYRSVPEPIYLSAPR